VSRNADGPPVAFGGGAQHLTVVERRLIGIKRDGASDRLRATGDRGRELTVPQHKLAGFNTDRAAVTLPRFCRNRAIVDSDAGRWAAGACEPLNRNCPGIARCWVCERTGAGERRIAGPQRTHIQINLASRCRATRVRRDLSPIRQVDGPRRDANTGGLRR